MLQKSDFSIGLISEAVDGCEAMQLLAQDNFDIVITDIRMPKMMGIEMIENVYEDGLEPYVIFLTACGPGSLFCRDMTTSNMPRQPFSMAYPIMC